jgi:XTP/dITP diphosphohydrolase
MSKSTKFNKIFFLTGNKKKFIEANNILSKYRLKLIMVKNSKKIEVQNDDIVQITKWIIENKTEEINGPTLVEDSGLFIPSLGGFPGPYSSYVYRTLGLHGILKILEGNKDRKAEFKSALAFKDLKGVSTTFLGITEGMISEYPRGSFGFGFDPIFICKYSLKTFGEMEIKEKNKYSHRAIAFSKFVDWFINIYNKIT